MTILRMAWRNIWRHKGRTILSLLAIGLSVMTIVVAKGLVDGIMDSFIDTAIRFSLGHVRLVNADYPRNERTLPLAATVGAYDDEGYSGVLRKVDEVHGVAAAAPRVRFGALITHGQDMVRVLGVGIVPSREERLSRLGRYLRDGHYPRPGAAEILAGRRLLEKLGLRLGDRVTLVVSTADGSLNGRTFTLAGSIASGVAQLDQSSVYLTLDEAQRLVHLDRAVTEIAVLLNHKREISRVVPVLQRVLDESGPKGRYTVEPYYKANPMTGQAELGKKVYDVMYGAILILASFVVMNTMVMIVNERAWEIGTLGALGFAPRQVSLLFALEGAVLGLVGSLIGAAVGGVLIRVLSITGLDTSIMVQGMDQRILFPTKIYPTFSMGLLVFAMTLGILITTIAVLLPARRAQRLGLVEALRT